MRDGAIFSAGVIGSVVVVQFCKSGVALCTSGRGVIVMVVQLTWSCLCLRSGGAEVLRGVARNFPKGFPHMRKIVTTPTFRRCAARKSQRHSAHTQNLAP